MVCASVSGWVVCMLTSVVIVLLLNAVAVLSEDRFIARST